VDRKSRFDGVVAEAPPGAGWEGGFVALPASFLQPNPQDGGGGRGERHTALFAALSPAAHVRSGAKHDVTAVQSGEFGQSQPGLHGQHQQCTVATALPADQVRCGQ
jgi:hypothetical protein